MDTELCGLIPDDWRVRSVEDVCLRVTSGGTPSRHEPAHFVGGSWPWAKTQELHDTWLDDTEEHITNEAVACSSAKVLPLNTVLVAMYGATVGQLGLLRRPMTCNQACCALIVDPKEADYRYLFFQLLYARSELKGLATGAAQQNLSGQLIRSLRFPFPPIREQRAIAHILGALDDKIELNRQMNETLEAMARALFKSWFIDFDPVHAKAEGHDPGLPADIAALFPDSFEDSELGEIPKGWKVGAIESLCKSITSGGTPARMNPLFWINGTIPWFKTGELLDGPLIESEEHITEAALKASSCKLWPAGTILFALYASPTVGRLGVLTCPSTSNQAAAGLIAKPEFGVPFLRRTLLEARVRLQTIAVGAAQQNINQGVLKSHRTVIPCAGVASTYSRLVSSLDEQQVSLKRQADTLFVLRDTLLPKLLSGELRVKGVDQSMEAHV